MPKPTATDILEFWEEVEKIGWGTKTTDYLAIERGLVKAWSRGKAARMRSVFLEVTDSLYKACGTPAGNDASEFATVLAHVIGLGREEFNLAIKFPVAVQRRASIGDFTESFAFCIPYDHAYAYLDQKVLIAEANRIVIELEEGLRDSRFHEVRPQTKELLALFQPATRGSPMSTVRQEDKIIALCAVLEAHANKLGLQHCRNTARFAYGGRIALFLHTAGQYGTKLPESS